MDRRIRAFWDDLFGQKASAFGIPSWAATTIRFVYLVVKEFNRNRCLEKAAALGFQTILSIVPALVLALFFIRSFGASELMSRDVTRLILHQLNVDEIIIKIPAPAAGDAAAPGARPAAAAATFKLSDKIQEILDDVDNSLRASGVNILSLLGLVITAIFLALEIEYSMNAIWNVSQSGLVQRIGLYWSLITLGPLLIVLGIYTGRSILAPIPLEFLADLLIPLAAFFLIYKLVPSVPIRTTAALAGALVGSLAWQAAKYGFKLYLLYAVGYGKLYGTLGLLPIFVVWIWVGWATVLIGAETAYTLQCLPRLWAEERRRRGAPFIQPAWAALGLVLEAGRAFLSGAEPVSGEELAIAIGIPAFMWKRIAELLIERRVLIKAGEDGRGLIPAKPLDALRVEEILAAAEDTLLVKPDEKWCETDKLRDLIASIAAARRQALRDLSVADLLAPTK